MKLGIDEIDSIAGILTGLLFLGVLYDKFITSPALLLTVAWVFLILAILDLLYIFIDPIGLGLKVVAWLHSLVDMVLAFAIITHLVRFKIKWFTTLGAYVFEPNVGLIVALFLVVGNAIWLLMYPFL